MSLDPLVHLYYGWSPYNYVLGGPIRFIDPDGRKVEDHYYDENGNYLYTDNLVTDNIKIINSSDWASIKENYGGQLGNREESSMDLMNVLDENSTIVSDANISTDAWSKITTGILNDMSDVNVSDLKDGKINITVYLYGGSADSELRTVSNVQNSLDSHEYDGHSKKGYGDKTSDHSKAYQTQFNHPSWQGTTSDFKKYHQERHKDYKNNGN